MKGKSAVGLLGSFLVLLKIPEEMAHSGFWTFGRDGGLVGSGTAFDMLWSQ